jgi:hypothetical protein
MKAFLTIFLLLSFGVSAWGLTHTIILSVDVCIPNH